MVPAADEVIVKSSEGLVAGPDQPIVKTIEIPAILVSSLSWFPDIRSQIPTFQEQWKDMDPPSLLKLRQGVLRDTIRWQVPAALQETIAIPSEQLAPLEKPAKMDIPKRKIDKP